MVVALQVQAKTIWSGWPHMVVALQVQAKTIWSGWPHMVGRGST
jgi:hypothetical protein